MVLSQTDNVRARTGDISCHILSLINATHNQHPFQKHLLLHLYTWRDNSTLCVYNKQNVKKSCPLFFDQIVYGYTFFYPGGKTWD